MWPSAGYVTKSGEQASQGLRHPSSIVHNGYLYIFVLDTSMDGTGGVKLARVRVEDVLCPNRYQTWANSRWVASLPEGFSAAKIEDFFSVRGPANTSTVLHDKNIIRFSVARYNEEPDSFIAVEEYINNDNSIEVAFRYSDDLINWSDRQLVIYRANSWHDSEFRYPVFMNTKGLTDGSIQLDEFYVIGSRHDGNLTKLYFQSMQENENGANQDGASNGGSMYRSSSKGGEKEKPTGKSFSTFQNFSDVSVHPIPAQNTLDLNFKVVNLTRIYVALYKLNGEATGYYLEETFLPQMVKRTIDLSGLSMGAYILKISDNKHTEYKKIIKL